MKPSVSIVILNWNGRQYLQQFLPSVMNTTYGNFRVVVADNGSTDDSVSLVRSAYPGIEVICNEKNYGFAKGYNQALKRVDSDYYVLLNSDVEVQPGWLEPMIDLLENNLSVAVCQPKLLQFTQKNMFEYAGAAGGWLDYLGYPFAKGRIFDVCEADEGQYEQAEPIFWASGAAMFIRSSIFHELQGFDEFFFAHHEEIDLCWRVQLAGYGVYSCPSSVVYHLGGGTLPKGNAQKVFLNFRNNLVMLAKNSPLAQALWKIPFRFLLDHVSAFKSLLWGETTYFRAVIRAHFAFLDWLFLKKRRNWLPPERTKPLHGYSRKSVVWQHFVLGRTKFSQIVKRKI